MPGRSVSSWQDCWLFSSASGVPTVYLGLIQLPDLLHKDKAVGDGVWRDTSVVADQVQIKFLLYQLAQKDAPKR